jgi:hypothetical protein
MKNFLINPLIVMFVLSGLLISLCYPFEIPEGYEKITDDCYLQIDPYGSESKEIGRLHFRGLKYADKEYLTELWIAIDAIEGVVGCTPNFYKMDVVIGDLYSWDEIKLKIRAVLEARKSTVLEDMGGVFTPTPNKSKAGRKAGIE